MTEIKNYLIGRLRLVIFLSWVLWFSILFSTPLALFYYILFPIARYLFGDPKNNQSESILNILEFRVIAFVKKYWCRSVIVLLQLLGVESKVSLYVKEGDERTKEKLKLWLSDSKPEAGTTVMNDFIFSNHQIYADWIYIWWFLDAIDRASEMVIILRSDLRRIPVLGFAMDRFGFIFVERNWQLDRINFINRIRRMKVDPHPSCLLLFPEGTVYCENTHSKSLKFAESKGLVPMKKVLHPKYTGSYSALKEMDSSLQGIFNLTIGYEGVKDGVSPQDTFSITETIAYGKKPRSIHILAEYIPMKDVPLHPNAANGDDTGLNNHISSIMTPSPNYSRSATPNPDLEDSTTPDTDAPTETFKTWLRNLYHEKDRNMQHFYESASFPHPKALSNVRMTQHHEGSFSDWLTKMVYSVMAIFGLYSVFWVLKCVFLIILYPFSAS